jgi:hypothetical protein
MIASRWRTVRLDFGVDVVTTVLFDGTLQGKFTLSGSSAYDNGVLYLRYHPAA